MQLPLRAHLGGRSLTQYLWTSPGIMTASSVGTRAFAFFAPIPFLNAHFSDAVVALWLVILTFQSLIAAINGTLPTVFMHMVSYGAAGSSSFGGFGDAHKDARGEPNWPFLRTVCRLTLRVFLSLTAIWLVLAFSLGVLVVWEPVARTGLSATAWTLWVVFVVGASFRIGQQGFIAFLLGIGRIMEVRRLEALSWLAGGIGATLVLSVKPDLVLAMALLQAPLIVNYFILRGLAKQHGWGVDGDATQDRQLIFEEVAPRAWRGSVGVLASSGAVYGSGLFYAQIGESSDIAGYLLALSLIGMVGYVAQTPFSVRHPMLGRLWAQGKREEQNRTVTEGVVRSMWLFAVLALAAPIAIGAINTVLPASIAFVDTKIWTALVISTALLRYGSMQLQSYTVTNDVRWHIVDTTNAALFLAILWVLFDGSVITLPISQIIALSLFYVPYARYLNYRQFGYSLAEDIPRAALPLLVAVGSLALYDLAVTG